MHTQARIMFSNWLYSVSSTVATMSTFSMQYSLESVMDVEDFYILMAVIENISIGKM